MLQGIRPALSAFGKLSREEPNTQEYVGFNMHRKGDKEHAGNTEKTMHL
jgi:hypothetical protein